MIPPDRVATAVDVAVHRAVRRALRLRGRAVADRIEAADLAIDRSFDHLRGRPPADRAFYAASTLGDFSVLWMFLGSIRGLRSDRDADAAIRLLVCLGLESALVNGLIKSLLPRGRPIHDAIHPFRLRTPKTASFPSGHASAGFTAATLLADGQKAPWRYGWYGLAAVVAASRVHTRSHHASDVVAGTVLGLALGRLAKRVWPLPPPGHGGTRLPAGGLDSP